MVDITDIKQYIAKYEHAESKELIEKAATSHEIAAFCVSFEPYGFSNFISFTPRKVNSFGVLCYDTNNRCHLR